VGHTALTLSGQWLAAVLACGPQAVLSHRDAAMVWGITDRRGERTHVTTPRRGGRKVPDGIHLHRVGTLGDDEVTETYGIPLTTVARTLLDLAATVQGRKMEAFIAQADRLELFDLRELRRLMNAHPRSAGIAPLRGLLDMLHGNGPAETRSPGEVALLQLCDDHGLPAPHTNVVVEGFLVDAHWPQSTLIAEVDGYDFHRTPHAFAADRDRDQVLAVAGYTVVRFTKGQLERRRRESAWRLSRLLSRRRGA
jgi:hypothetical protein